VGAEPQNFSDPRAVNISYGGSAVEGFADGVFCTITRNSDSFGSKVGARGAVGIFPIHDPVRIVKISVLATAPVNDMFSSAMRSQRTQGAKGVGSVLSIRDGVGTSVAKGKAVIQKPPDKKYSAGVEANEWTFLMVIDEASEVIGGNSVW